MRYIDQWLSGLGLDHVIPLLQAQGITTPKKLALLTLRDIYEVVGVEDSEDRKKLYFLIQRLQSILKKEKTDDADNTRDESDSKPRSSSGNGSGSRGNTSLSPPRTSPSKKTAKRQTSLSSPPKGSTDGRDTDTPPSSPSSQVPRASFVDISPLRQPNRQAREIVNTRKTTSSSRESEIVQHDDDNESDGNVSDDHQAHRSSTSDSNSPQERTHNPSATMVRDDLKLLRRQHRQSVSRDSAHTNALTPDRDKDRDRDRDRDINTSNSSINVRYTSPIIPPKPAPVPSSQTPPPTSSSSKRGPVAVPVSHSSSSPTRNKKYSRNAPSPPPSPPPAPPSFDVHHQQNEPAPPARIHTNLNRHSQTRATTDSTNNPTNHSANELRDPSTIADYISDMAIRVVVRKRPISRSEEGKGDIDILEVFPRGKVLVHEPKTKVDLTKIIETQEFIFDDAFDYYSNNEEIYTRVIRSLVATMFEGGKGSCFAYGQTGSGKTFTMMGSNPAAPAQARENAGLYVLAARDIFYLLEAQETLHKRRLMVSCFEIYSGKLFDLLNERKPVKCLEDSKQRVQLPGLSEHCVGSVQELLDMMSQAHGQRSTGSTGANMESSRSHQVLQLQIVEERVQKSGKIIKKPCGKLSFIDLAGSERGADTSNNSKQTRLEGAEINTSLLALKEVIRSLERKHGHTPFRGSKLTQVLKDSFVGANTKTCMVACVSPSMANCEHTLNTLRYADRVKEHQQRNGEDDRDMRPSSAVPSSSAEQLASKEVGGRSKLNPETNMLLKNGDHYSRPNTSAGSHHREKDIVDDVNIGDLDIMSKHVKQPKKRSSLLQAPNESSRQHQASRNSRLSLQPHSEAQRQNQRPAKTNDFNRGETKYSNRISASRMSLNGPPPPPDTPEDLDVPSDNTSTAPTASGGIRLRKGSATNGIKIHKGHNNSSNEPDNSNTNAQHRQATKSKIPSSPRGHSRALTKQLAPPPPPSSAPPDTYQLLALPSTQPPTESPHSSNDDNKRHSYSSPILVEPNLDDPHSHASVYEERATEALLSLSALASVPLSPSHKNRLSYDSEEDHSSTSSDNSSDVDHDTGVSQARRQTVSPPRVAVNSTSGAGGTELLGKTVALVSAHKLAIAEMVEVMKLEMELVQNMETADDRDSEAYAQELEDLLRAKHASVGVLRAELKEFQAFRSASK